MDESELDLGLGLSLGGGGGEWDHQNGRISTARDFSSAKAAASSSSSSSSVTQTTAEPSSPTGRSGASSHVVGWPPIRTYRVNSLVNHAKSPATEEYTVALDKCKSKKNAVDNTNFGSNKNYFFVKEKGLVKASFLVKVSMDGFPIGRKVDMNAHDCYETLAQTIDGMFSVNAGAGARLEEQPRGPARLLGGSSDFVLTYEDKDGDWMLVGDVPWEMFLSSVRRLKIMRTTEANGFAPNPMKKLETVNKTNIK